MVSGLAESALWQALLPPALGVEDRVFDQDNLCNSHTQPNGGSALVPGLRHGYAGVYAASPVALPAHPVVARNFPALAAAPGPRTPLLGRAEVAGLSEDAARAQRDGVAADLLAHARAGTLPDAVRHAQDVADHLARVTGRTPGPLFPDDGTLAGQLGRLVAFHTVPSRVAAPADLAAPADPGTLADPGDPQAAFTPELHSVITLLHEHPSLLSRLGLLIDLTIPNGELPQIGLNARAGARLRVTVTSAGGAASAGTLRPAPPTTARGPPSSVTGKRCSRRSRPHPAPRK